MRNLFYVVGLFLIVVSCSKSVSEFSIDEAKDFLESHAFTDDDATITGISGGKLTSSFTLRFENNNAIIGSETVPYTIEKYVNERQFSGNGFQIKICGSERYAYGECITVYLSGEKNVSLQVKGDYVKAYMNDRFGAIVKK